MEMAASQESELSTYFLMSNFELCHLGSTHN